MPGLGHKSYVQFTKESTYGTLLPSTRRLEIISWNVSPQIGAIQDPSLYAAQSRRGLYQGGMMYRGTFVVRLNYEGLEELFRAVFGTYSNSIVTAVTRDHFFKEGSTLNSYTFEVSAGDVTANTVFRLIGAKVTGLTIRGTAGVGTDAMLQAEFTVIAKDATANNAPTTPLVTGLTISGLRTVTRGGGSWIVDGIGVGSTVTGANFAAGAKVESVTSGTVLVMDRDCTNGSALSGTFTLAYPAVFPVLFHQAITVDDGTPDTGANLRVRAIELTLEQPHAEDRFYFGAQNIDEPLRTDFLTARWRLTQEFTTIVQFDSARAFTAGSPKFVFRHPAAITNGFREFEIRSEKANLVEYSNPIEGYGVLISTATWEAWYDTTDVSALVARFRNDLVALP